MDDPRYPIGTMEEGVRATPELRARWIAEMAALPEQLAVAVERLTPEQIDTPYRRGGWTVRQLIHHIPDSHLQAYTRFKLALTEDDPIIKPYDEAAWAELPDSRVTPPEVSLTLTAAIHTRWLDLIRAMSDSDFRRTFRHPELNRSFTLDEVLGRYAWHGRHHLAHITGLRERMGWK
jgi:uncharacterized damage-inducible protein DinB